MKGYKQNFTESNVYTALDDHETKTISQSLRVLWRKESRKDQPNLFTMLFKAFGPSVCLAGFYYMFCELITRSFHPFLLSSLVTYFNRDQDKITKHEAYFLAIGLILCTFVPVINYHHYIIYISQKFLKIKVGCTALIYDKVRILS